MEEISIINQLNKLITEYDSPVELGYGLSRNPRDVLKSVLYITASEYESGNLDENGIEKPYLQIANGIRNTANTATEIDPKSSDLFSGASGEEVKVFVLKKRLQNWFFDENFGVVLDDLNNIRNTYGGVLAKKVTDKKRIWIESPSWHNIFFNGSDILNSPIIERHFITKAELSTKKAWNKDSVQNLLEEYEDKNEQIPIWEIHGEFPVSLYKEAKDEEPGEEDKFTYQRYVFYVGGESDKQLLYCDEENELPYKFCPSSSQIAGLSMGIGYIEKVMQAQWWTNDAIIKAKQANDLSSKVVSQTTDDNLDKANILTELKTGDILTVAEGKDIRPVQLLPSNPSESLNLRNLWWDVAQRESAAYDAARGETDPSNNTFRGQAIIQQQAQTSFNKERKDFASFVDEILNDWVLPHLIKNTTEREMSAEFSATELVDVHKNIVETTVMKHLGDFEKKGILITSQELIDQKREQLYEELMARGSQIFFKIPKDFFKNFTARHRIITSNDVKDKNNIRTALVTLIDLVGKNMQVLDNPVMTELLSRIIEVSDAGISPTILQKLKTPQKQAQNPQMQGQMPTTQPPQDPSQNQVTPNQVDQNNPEPISNEPSNGTG